LWPRRSSTRSERAGRSSWFALLLKADVGEEAALVSCQQLRYIPLAG
jgi:hypothetical protein